MQKSKKLLWIALGLLLLPASAAVWLALHTMNPAMEYELGDASNAPHVLIATQGSEYKNALVTDLVARLKARPTRIKVIDVTHLKDIHVDDWNAVVIVHTWQIGKPQPDAKAFVENKDVLRKLIVVTTSGSGEEKLPGVDALSSASSMQDLQTIVDRVSRRLDAVLATS